ncbi:MAG: iron uptake porin, partial [Cyanobium sp. MAG_237]|nr:iron uptake porin [Cyanobium sp. MAG_237]
MKLFKQLLVAPAALGLLAPVAATAAEFNLDGVNKYASEEQVTSISQFSDVKPTDWAYQALSNLIERYGCVAGYPNGTYKGGKAMTRFEAAALLNACLDRVTEVTDELKKLMAEFEKELAILKGRVDGLEAKVGQLEANQFSTTTKLKGIATMVLGGASGLDNGAVLQRNLETRGEVTFNYDLKLDLDTSFTGKDLLRTR